MDFPYDQPLEGEKPGVMPGSLIGSPQVQRCGPTHALPRSMEKPPVTPRP